MGRAAADGIEGLAVNLDDWKEHCEMHAGHVIQWHDVRDAYWGMTAWGDDGDGTYCIIPAIDPQCVVIRNGRQKPLIIASVQLALL